MVHGLARTMLPVREVEVLDKMMNSERVAAKHSEQKQL